MADDEAAVGEGGGGAAHGVDADAGELGVGGGVGAGEGDVAAVVFEDDDFAVGEDGGGDGAGDGLLPAYFSCGEVHALVFFAAGEVDVAFVDDGGAGVAAGDPEVGPGGFGRGVFLVLSGAEADAVGAAVEDEPVAAGDGSGLAAAFDGPEDFAGGGFEAEEGVAGGVKEERAAGVGLPPLGAAGVTFGVFLFPDEFAGGGFVGLGGAGADEDFAIGDEGRGGGAFAGEGRFPNFFAGGGVDAVEVGAGDGVDAVVDDSGGAGGVAADGEAFAFVAPDFFAGGEVEADDDVVGDFDGVGDDGEEFVLEFGGELLFVHPLAEGGRGGEGFVLAGGDFVEFGEGEGGAAGFEAGGGPRAEGDAVFFGHVVLEPLFDEDVEFVASEAGAEGEAGVLEFFGEVGFGAAVVELLHDFGVDFTLFGGDAFMPDDAEVDAFAGDDGAAVAAVVIAGDGVAFPEFSEAGVGDGIGDGSGVGGDAAAGGAAPLGPVGEEWGSEGESEEEQVGAAHDGRVNVGRGPVFDGNCEISEWVGRMEGEDGGGCGRGERGWLWFDGGRRST